MPLGAQVAFFGCMPSFGVGVVSLTTAPSSVAGSGDRVKIKEREEKRKEEERKKE